VDTLNWDMYITSQRASTFVFTNPLRFSQFAAFYPTQNRNNNAVRFDGLAAYIHWEVYSLVALVHEIAWYRSHLPHSKHGFTRSKKFRAAAHNSTLMQTCLFHTSSHMHNGNDG